MDNIQDKADLLKDKLWNRLSASEIIAIEKAKDELREVMDRHQSIGVLALILLSAEALETKRKQMEQL